MQGGFSFCGTDIADLGLEYVPDNANTYVFAGSTYKVHEQSFDGHDGGYHYGSTLAAKSFSLRCIYQESHINNGILTRAESFFRRNKTGKLIFKNRPWVYYIATVTGLDTKSFTNYLNGFVTIQMKAYYPFGRCSDLFYDAGCENELNIVQNSSMLPMSYAAPTTFASSDSPITEQSTFILYNGGTEPSKIAIEIAGDAGQGVTIANTTTGQRCSFIALTKAITSDAGFYIVSDGINGRTVLTNGSAATDASLYHDYGFIDLEPNVILVPEARYSVTSAGIQNTLDDMQLSDDTIGKYVYVQGSWRKIKAFNNEAHTSAVISPAPSSLEVINSPVVSMNEIVVTPISDMSLTRQNFVYNPTFA